MNYLPHLQTHMMTKAQTDYDSLLLVGCIGATSLSLSLYDYDFFHIFVSSKTSLILKL